MYAFVSKIERLQVAVLSIEENKRPLAKVEIWNKTVIKRRGKNDPKSE
jgi:hypothetical protein